MEGVEEQVGIRTMDDSCYIERYGMEQPGHGASLYKYTFLKITDTNLQLEDEIKYMFGATYGECTVNGTDYYTGNADSDIVNVENVLMKYALDPGDAVGEPLISDLYRERLMDASTYSQQDTFSVRNDFIPASDQTTQAETTDSTEENLSARGLSFARNEMMARMGRGFKNQELADYFKSTSWYQETVSPEVFDAQGLPSIVEANASLMMDEELRLNGGELAIK